MKSGENDDNLPFLLTFGLDELGEWLGLIDLFEAIYESKGLIFSSLSSIILAIPKPEANLDGFLTAIFRFLGIDWVLEREGLFF